MAQYEVLLKVLDKLREEAPEEYKSYHPNANDTEKLNAARSKAYIHLFLKVKCGITSFKMRQSCITEGSQDGGIDAYFIDRENKKLYLIQSKFRTKEDNFTAKSISADDLIEIEVNRILKGEKTDSSGKEFNSKIQQLQKEWSEVGDQAKYNYRVYLLGNVKKLTDEQLRKLLDNCDYEILDFERSYNELVFPLCSGTYYDPKEIKITINLYNKEQSTLKQKITTKYGDYDVRIIFVPVEEVAEIMLKYKNSLLKYNPRNYLTLSENKVNQEIRRSIVDRSNNEFAVFNNGITILTDSFSLSETTGKKYEGQLILTNPQIINGGQTAYTLASISEEYKDSPDEVFKGKEVLFKIIVMPEEKEPETEFIEKLSDATNKQTTVDEADRRSNLSIQVKIQSNIYNEYGFFYERKRGEFYNGLQSKYILPSRIIDRYEFLRAYHALKGNPSEARQKGKETLFKIGNFNAIIDSSSSYKRMFFSWLLLRFLYTLEQRVSKNEWEKLEEFKKLDFGFSLRYGKMAVISAVGLIDTKEEELVNKRIFETAQKSLLSVLEKWKKFEDTVRRKEENKDYMIEGGFDLDNYYKGRTVDSDINEFYQKH
jgi:hypothetical protein